MDVMKLTIYAEIAQGTYSKHVEALFNPHEISIQQTVNWSEEATSQRDVPNSQHTNADAATLSLELLFDTYEDGSDVRDYTNKVQELTKIETHGKIHRPPVCLLGWGSASIFFEGVLQSLTQKFTLFLADGLPVRATLTCAFKQYRDDTEEIRIVDLQSSDVEKRHTVRVGDTLSSIAAGEYHDPKIWRPIADRNRLEDPRRLHPGIVLAIPRLRKERAERS